MAAAGSFLTQGRTQVSDKASPAVLLVRSPRCSGNARPTATEPFIISWAFRAGMNTLFHPKGRSGLLPTGTPMTNGSPKSNQVMEIVSSSVSMFSVQKKAVSPALLNTALMTGICYATSAEMAEELGAFFCDVGTG